MARKIGILSTREKVGYALGDGASNFYWKVFEFFILIFYTDVFGITAAAAGWMFLLTRVWDAVNDPLMGMLADRTRTKWGKYRPFLVWLALPMAVVGVLCFTTPAFSAGGKLAYAYVTYILMMMIYTAINIPYSALMGVITPDTKERAQLSSYRFLAAFIVSMIVVYSTPKLVSLLGEGNDQLGWQLVMALYGAVAAGLFVACFATTKERVEPPASQQTDVAKDWGSLLRNGPWFVMFFLGLLVIAGFTMRGSTMVYYWKYYMGDEEGFGLFMLVGTFANVVGIALTPLLVRFVSKRTLYMVCMGLGGLLHIPFFWLGPDRVAEIYALNIVISLIMGPQAPLIFAMYADVADYGEWKTGRRATGLVMSAAMLALKVGGAIGGAMTGWMLSAHGYVPNQAQTATAITGILVLIAVIPAITGAGGAILVMLYRLSDEFMMKVEKDLAARRLAAEPDADGERGGDPSAAGAAIATPA